MKPITLRQLLDTNQFQNLLHLKKELISYKNSGVIFYKEVMSSLEIDTPFELYFVLSKGGIEYENAFPMPINFYREYLTYNRPLEYLARFYQEYYGTKNIPSDRFFQTLNVFQAKKYAWFYNSREDGKYGLGTV
ncbi:hypothetical protein P9711_02635 [Anoxybacillus geothermalis]|jgi:hypothetical protein|uniref:hypothetical protein n=1 Tax=Parageobacillus toebii TaxID=153151 RepID=UPI002E24B2A0|nr:hypothetical protein [Anoxybacillus geothermalis]MED4990459.1 hypothetical protein [Parageobacillus toebii]